MASQLCLSPSSPRRLLQNKSRMKGSRKDDDSLNQSWPPSSLLVFLRSKKIIIVLEQDKGKEEG